VRRRARGSKLRLRLRSARARRTNFVHHCKLGACGMNCKLLMTASQLSRQRSLRVPQRSLNKPCAIASTQIRPTAPHGRQGARYSLPWSIAQDAGVPLDEPNGDSHGLTWPFIAAPCSHGWPDQARSTTCARSIPDDRA
jgi:hypothetical protein